MKKWHTVPTWMPSSIHCSAASHICSVSIPARLSTFTVTSYASLSAYPPNGHCKVSANVTARGWIDRCVAAELAVDLSLSLHLSVIGRTHRASYCQHRHGTLLHYFVFEYGGPAVVHGMRTTHARQCASFDITSHPLISSHAPESLSSVPTASHIRLSVSPAPHIRYSERITPTSVGLRSCQTFVSVKISMILMVKSSRQVGRLLGSCATLGCRGMVAHTKWRACAPARKR